MSQQLVSAEPTTTTQLDEEGVNLVSRIAAARRAMKMWKAEEADAHDALVKLMGVEDPEPGVYEGHFKGRKVVFVNAHTTNRFDSAAFRDDHPDLYDRYKKSSVVSAVRVPDIPPAATA